MKWWCRSRSSDSWGRIRSQKIKLIRIGNLTCQRFYCNSSEERMNYLRNRARKMDYLYIENKMGLLLNTTQKSQFWFDWKLEWGGQNLTLQSQNWAVFLKQDAESTNHKVVKFYNIKISPFREKTWYRNWKDKPQTGRIFL